MQNKDINNLIITGSDKYYKFLDENEKGLIVFDVVGVERIFSEGSRKVLYRFKMDKRIKNTENLQVQVREKTYLSNQIKIILHDEDKRELIIHVVANAAKEEVAGLENFDASDVKAILDLKYLVSRTGDWFKAHDIILPTKIEKIKDISVFDSTSRDQEQAVRFCLENPFSYVWGAPGSGKSKFVLTNAVLNLFRAGKRVLIVAPTNNAIEQALMCIIDRFDSENIERSNIFRLGLPSKAFAEIYPETIEQRGISKQLAEIKQQKERLEDIIKYKSEKDTFPEIVAALEKKVGKDGKLTTHAKLMLKNLETAFEERKRLYAAYDNPAELEKLKKQVDELSEQIEEVDAKGTAARVNKMQVVGMTADGYIGYANPALGTSDIPHFDHIFLDEAGYCCLAKAATLFAIGVPVTFLGDHFQLPPVCEMDDDAIIKKEQKEVFVWAQSALYLADLIEGGAETEFLRYSKKLLPSFAGMQKTNLTETYRFGQNLLDVLCKSIYITQLTSKNSSGIEIQVIDARKTKFTEKKRENIDEAEAIADYCRKNYLELPDMAILAPYKNQISLLRKLCFRLVGDSILTIHGSQGREWDTVIISVCDTTDKYFTDSLNPRSNGKLILNTAISRVKKKLIIVCDEGYWKTQDGQLLCELVKNKTGGAR